MNRWLLTILGFAVCSTSAAQTAWDIELPDGDFVGGFVEDDGDAVVLLNRRAPDWWRSDRASESAEGGSFFVRLASDGSISGTIDMPKRSATGLSRLDHGLLWLGTKDTVDQAGVSAIHEEFVELTPTGRVARIWGWNPRDRPDWRWAGFIPSSDGKAWALYPVGEPDLGVIDRLHFRWGDLEPAEAEIDGEVVLRFGDSAGETWRPVEGESPAPVFLDSSGPVFSVYWKDRTYILHMAEDGSVKHRIRVFGEESERSTVWQDDERVQWSRTDEHLRAYHLPDLGLSGEVTKPFWIVERNGADGKISPHRTRAE